MIVHMTVVRINAITVPADSGDELARRFAARAGAVDNQDGFEGFELLKPTDGRTTWLVVTRWRDEEAFQAWMQLPGVRARAPFGGRAGGRPGAAPGRDQQRAVVIRSRRRILRLRLVGGQVVTARRPVPAPDHPAG